MKLMVEKWLSSFLKSVLNQKNKKRKFGLERRGKKASLKKARSNKTLKNDMFTNQIKQTTS